MANIEYPKVAHGRICYVEIPAQDINISSAFYQKIFGWNTRTRSDGRIAFDDGIGKVSGTWVQGREPAAEPGLIVSIMVDDIEATMQAIISAGCAIVNKIQIGETEFVAWFADPAGNILGLYQHPGGGHGKICYLEIPAADINKSVEFYKAIFPWQIRSDSHGNAAFDDVIGNVSGMWAGHVKPVPSGLVVYTMVDSVAETAEKIVAHGGAIVKPPRGNSKEDDAIFSDPEGNIMGIGQE